MMNNLNHNQFFRGFYMEKRGPQVSHLSFADDVIIFTLGGKRSIELIMQKLTDYEECSGQLINRNKSHFMVHTNAYPPTVASIKAITVFTQKDSPITYLGCPLYIGRQRISHFSGIISKVVDKISGWQTKMLSYGGKATLIKYVLQSLPIHLLSSVSPLSTVLTEIEKLNADFYWGMKNGRKRYHWASWDTLCHPCDEGGVGFRKIRDVCKSLELKQWWNFRTKEYLWRQFLLAKYCQRSHRFLKSGILVNLKLGRIS